MIFGRYAQFYDIFYKRKDYKKECSFLEEIFKSFSSSNPRTILDLGCGTGGHAIPLRKKGYRVTGLDTSSFMLAQAKEKSRKLNLKIDFFKKPLQRFNLNQKFDAVICMFSVIDYLKKDDELKSMLKNVRAHLGTHSLFVFDFWNEEAVSRFYSSRRQKIFKDNKRRIERKSVTQIFPGRKLCAVNYLCTSKENGRLTTRFKEQHVVRYFSIGEMFQLLRKAGLEIVTICPFLSLRGAIRENTWDITVVARGKV